MRRLRNSKHSSSTTTQHQRSRTRIHVAAVQMKFRPSIQANVSRILEMIGSASGKGADAVLLPECAITGYNCDFTQLDGSEVEASLKQIASAARDTQCHVLVGSPILRDKKWFNSLIVFDRRGHETYCYSKIHLTKRDALFFSRGNTLAFFKIDRIPCTAIICHERRFPELVRIPAMMGAQIVFHPNAGLDALKVSKSKRGGRDGISVRAFENQVFYVFANSVGPQGAGLWSAGDSKIVAPDSSVLALADNRTEMIVHANLTLVEARRDYPREALVQPAFLRKHWRSLLSACRKQSYVQRTR